MDAISPYWATLGLLALPAYWLIGGRRRRAAAGSRPRHVLITGCDTGFGRSSAEALAAKGYRVHAACLRGDSAFEHDGITVHVCNVTSAKDVAALATAVGAACEADGGLWALINNAGIARPCPIELLTMQDFRDVMEVNFFGTVAVTKAVLPLIKQARGRIANITSVCGIVSIPFNANYAASKFACEAFSDGLRREMAPFGVAVSTIEPGGTKTAILTEFADNFRRTAAKNGPVDAYPGDFLESYAKLLEGAPAMASDPQVVIDAIVSVVEDAVPRKRMPLGPDAKILYRPLSVLPDWIGDWFMSKLVPAPPTATSK